MKTHFVFLIILVLLSFNLASCITYRSENNGFQPAPPAVKTAKKAYIRNMYVSTTGYAAFDIHLKNNVGKIISYVNAARPDIFSEKEEGAVPILLRLESTSFKEEISSLNLLSLITLGMVPNQYAQGWHFVSRAITPADYPYQLEVTDVETLEISTMNSFLLLPVFWPFFFLGPGSTIVDPTVNDTLYEKNWFMTQEFADNMAFLASKLMLRVEKYEKKKPGDIDYREPQKYVPPVQIKDLPL